MATVQQLIQCHKPSPVRVFTMRMRVKMSTIQNYFVIAIIISMIIVLIENVIALFSLLH